MATVKHFLFQLPLVVLKRKAQIKYVSFVFVPYTVLLSNMVSRLSSSNILSVETVKTLIDGLCMENEETLADVYVGTFNDLGNARFRQMFNSWGEMKKNTKVGLFIIDEFHSFEDDWSYREESFREIPYINFNVATKLLLPSGTMGNHGFEKCFKRIGLNVSLTNYLGDTDKVYVYNEIKDIPLDKIIKYSELFKSSKHCKERAIEILDAFLKFNGTNKAIVICGNVETAIFFSKIYKNPTLAYGDMETNQKSMNLQKFVDNPSVRLFFGTCLVGEGIDISSVELVLMLDYYPSISKYIQAVGRIRKHGVCWCLWCCQQNNIDKSIIEG